jgi:hypothetical protein
MGVAFGRRLRKLRLHGNAGHGVVSCPAPGDYAVFNYNQPLGRHLWPHVTGCHRVDSDRRVRPPRRSQSHCICVGAGPWGMISLQDGARRQQLVDHRNVLDRPVVLHEQPRSGCLRARGRRPGSTALRTPGPPRARCRNSVGKAVGAEDARPSFGACRLQMLSASFPNSVPSTSWKSPSRHPAQIENRQKRIEAFGPPRPLRQDRRGERPFGTFKSFHRATKAASAISTCAKIRRAPSRATSARGSSIASG